MSDTKVLTPEALSLSIRFACGEVAQSVEQWTENPRVRCSIHRLATIGLPTKSRGMAHKAMPLFLCPKSVTVPVSHRSSSEFLKIPVSNPCSAAGALPHLFLLPIPSPAILVQEQKCRFPFTPRYLRANGRRRCVRVERNNLCFGEAGRASQPTGLSCSLRRYRSTNAAFQPQRVSKALVAKRYFLRHCLGGVVSFGRLSIH
jgi:hypothetical protein